MQGARRAAVPVLLATLVAVAAGQPAGAEEDRTRRRAEELAETASQRFSEIMGEKRLAQAQRTEPRAGQAKKQSGGDDPWSVGLEWFDHSSREFQGLMRRLSQGDGTGPGAPARAPSSTPPAKPAPPPAATAKRPEAPAPDGVDWLTRSSQQFQTLMRGLAEGAPPPPTGPATKEPPPKAAEAPAAKPAAPPPAPPLLQSRRARLPLPRRTPAKPRRSGVWPRRGARNAKPRSRRPRRS